MQHSKDHGSLTCGFRTEDFVSVSLYKPVKHMTHNPHTAEQGWTICKERIIMKTHFKEM